MTTKLNLTIEEHTAQRIKLYAKKHKTSVSKLTESYFSKLLGEKSGIEKSFVEKHEKILSKYVNVPDFDIKKEREEYLKQKYGI